MSDRSARAWLLAFYLLFATTNAEYQPETGDLQLFGGNTDSGRLGIYYDGKWGTLCSHKWTLGEATVACRQLGFDKAFQAMLMPGYVDSEGTAWLSKVRCAGNESTLAECQSTGWNSGNGCAKQDSVGVSCLAEADRSSLHAAVRWTNRAFEECLRSLAN
jgi:hypothetical protein